MAELAPADLPAAVRDRFEDDDAAQLAIDTALLAARRFCGWHVSPVRTETVTLDGPSGRVLSLPSLNVTAVTSLIECGVAADVAKLDVSQRKGTVEKYPYGFWTGRNGAITVSFIHGFAEEEALDWRRAIVALVGSWSETSMRDGSDLKRMKVDDVEYEWFETAVSTDSELSQRFTSFRILPSP
jgi:hypothetical protein